MPYKDPEKKRQYQREWRKTNPQDQRPGKESRRDLVNKLKDKPCLHCGVKYPPCVMDLHHVDPSQKSFEVVPNGRGKDALIEEAKKCVCLCSNCHRLFHGGHIELNLESWQSG